MRRSLVVGNWKMHGTVAAARTLVGDLARAVASVTTEIAVCPPHVHLAAAVAAAQGSSIGVGAQNCSEHEAGAYTGEIAVSMLTELGCDRVILGHSERRQFYGETDALVVAKARSARSGGLIPILCVGESLDQREKGNAETVVATQLQALIADGLYASDVIAYEPVWAIGTGKTASPAQAQAMHAFIRGCLQDAGVAAASHIRLLYGGSVKAANAEELFGQPDIDGGLVGGASLDAEEFAAIAAAAQIRE